MAAGVMGTWGMVSAAPATAAVRSTPAPGGPSLALVGTVAVRDLPAKASAGHPAQHKPFLSPRLRTPATSAPANGTVTDSVSPRGGGTPASPRTAVLAAASLTTATVTAAFPGWSSSQSQTGFNQFWTPPDPQIAAGPAISGSPSCSAGCLMELVNDVGTLWSKSGQLQNSFDLNSFFKVPSGQTYSDPRVIFDAPSGRWFASGLSFTSLYGSQIYVAVSSTGDPSGAWAVYNGDYSPRPAQDRRERRQGGDGVE